jgi:hypothetical protein
MVPVVRNPSLNQRIYAPYKIAALVETLSDLGVPASESLRGSGLNPKQIYDPETRSSVGQYFIVCRNAIRLSNNPATPVLTGRRMHLSAYGMYGYALICSLTLRDFFDAAVRYHMLVFCPRNNW